MGTPAHKAHLFPSTETILDSARLRDVHDGACQTCRGKLFTTTSLAGTEAAFPQSGGMEKVASFVLLAGETTAKTNVHITPIAAKQQWPLRHPSFMRKPFLTRRAQDGEP